MPEKLRRRDVNRTFNSAKLPHSSHSFFTCVIPPINKTADLPISTDEARELVLGEGSDEVSLVMVEKR